MPECVQNRQTTQQNHQQPKKESRCVVSLALGWQTNLLASPTLMHKPARKTNNICDHLQCRQQETRKATHTKSLERWCQTRSLSQTRDWVNSSPVHPGASSLHGPVHGWRRDVWQYLTEIVALEDTAACTNDSTPRKSAAKKSGISGGNRQTRVGLLPEGWWARAEFAVLAGEVAGSGHSKTLQFYMPSASAKSWSAPPAFQVSVALAATEFGSSPLDPGNEDDATSEPVPVCDVKFFQLDKRLCSTAVIPFRHLQTVLISVLAPARMAHRTPMGASSFHIVGTVEAST